MPWSAVGQEQDNGQSGTAAVTHGLGINAGDLIVITLNVNGPQTITPVQGTGAPWSTAYNANAPSPETAQEAIFYKNANSAEPATFECTLGATDNWNMTVQVLRNTNPWAFTSVSSGIVLTANAALNCSAADGVTMAANSVGIICGGKDNRTGSFQVFDTADQSFTGVVGNAQNQVHGSAHRIFAAGLTLIGNVNLSGQANVGDPTYSLYATFTEASALPQITSVGGDDALFVGETGALVAGSNFGT